MLLKVRGIAYNFYETIVGRITTDTSCMDGNTVLVTQNARPENSGKFRAILTNLSYDHVKFEEPSVCSVQTFDHLTDGDIVALHPNGIIHTLYRVNSQQNFLLATERCNSNCLMCSQPPKDRDDVSYLFSIHKELIPLIPKNCIELGITGGEPTLMGDSFFELAQKFLLN
jgi:sulfatase maturation enzyme AslB (radical SAM superfamily)